MSILGLPIPGRTYQRQAVPSTSDTTTQWTPWSNHNQVCTIMNREPALLPCTSYHTRIMHGEGVGTADSTTTTLDTKADITTRIRVKIQSNSHRGHWPIITSHSGSRHKLFYTARSKRTKSPEDKQRTQLFLLSQAADWDPQATRRSQWRNHRHQ
jgi:hypothetical protein